MFFFLTTYRDNLKIKNKKKILVKFRLVYFEIFHINIIYLIYSKIKY